MKPTYDELESRVTALEQQVALIHGTNRPRKRTVRYRSSAHLLGIPLLEVALGPAPWLGERVGSARAVLAIGDFATGVIAIGGVARGGFTVGGISVGLFSIGGVSLGLLAGAGGVATGLVAAGGVAIGGVVAGGLAIGYWAVGGAVFHLQQLLG